MSYSELYEYCQGLSAPISSRKIQKKVEELSEKRVWRARTTMDPALLRGFFLDPSNPDHPIFAQHPNSIVIVTPRDCHKHLERLIFVKELMHTFDSELEHMNTGADLEDVLTGFCGAAVAGGRMSPKLRSEYLCQFMALGLLCHEAERVEMQQSRAGDKLTDAEIAQRLRLPEQFVPLLFIQNFKDIIDALTEPRS